MWVILGNSINSSGIIMVSGLYFMNFGGFMVFFFGQLVVGFIGGGGGGGFDGQFGMFVVLMGLRVGIIGFNF